MRLAVSSTSSKIFHYLRPGVFRPGVFNSLSVTIETLFGKMVAAICSSSCGLLLRSAGRRAFGAASSASVAPSNSRPPAAACVAQGSVPHSPHSSVENANPSGLPAALGGAGSLPRFTLGRNTAYAAMYDPELLVPVQRAAQRKQILADAASPPWSPASTDLWTAFEVSWLCATTGWPRAAVATVEVPAGTSCLVESKSLKLYLNSLNGTRATSPAAVAAAIAADLGRVAGGGAPQGPGETSVDVDGDSGIVLSEEGAGIEVRGRASSWDAVERVGPGGVRVRLSPLAHAGREAVTLGTFAELEGLARIRSLADATPLRGCSVVSLDETTNSATQSGYSGSAATEPSAALLRVAPWPQAAGGKGEQAGALGNGDQAAPARREALTSELLKSNCLVTGQPDWGSLLVYYAHDSLQLDREALLRYIVSFREHNEFHEHCVERVFADVRAALSAGGGPTELLVYARYTRRGGLDINPMRLWAAEPARQRALERFATVLKRVRLVRQ